MLYNIKTKNRTKDMLYNIKNNMFHVKPCATILRIKKKRHITNNLKFKIMQTDILHNDYIKLFSDTLIQKGFNNYNVVDYLIGTTTIAEFRITSTVIILSEINYINNVCKDLNLFYIIFYNRERGKEGITFKFTLNK